MPSPGCYDPFEEATIGDFGLDRGVPDVLAERLGLSAAASLLLVDAPEALARLLAAKRPPERPPQRVAGEAIRSVKEAFDAILVWREDRAGSRSLLDHLVKRLVPSGALWVVTAMKKVRGPRTPAARRLELADLVTAFSKDGLAHDREVRIPPWHMAYRFTNPDYSRTSDRNAGP